MTDNIVSTISRLLTPELIGKLASAAGLDRAMAPKATAAAVPAILSGLAEIAARPGGARQLASAVAEQPSDLIGSIANSLGGAQQIVDKGSNMLSSLLGGDMTGLLAASVGKFLGIGEAPMRALIGLLTPIIMGILGREQRTQGLDSNGLARLLTSQKDEIAAAMPAGLGRLLASSGFSGATGTPASPDRPAHETSRASLDPQRAASLRTAAEDGSRGLSWAYWVLPLLVLAGLIWFLLPQQERTVETVPPAQTTSLPTQPVADAAGKLTFLTVAREDWTSIGASANEYTNQDVYNSAGENLGTIRDVLIGPDGKAAAAVINVGRFLGIGDKEIAVPFSALRVERQGDNRRIIIDAVKEGVQAAPTFTRRPAVKQ
jgi:sporulation protein YlmC with PRC-barrel domain